MSKIDMEREGLSKVGEFWIGFAAMILLFFAIYFLLFATLSFFGMFGIGFFVLLLLILFILLIMRPNLRYYALGALTFGGAVLIFGGTCATGGAIGSVVESGEFAGLGGLMLSLPFAIIFAIVFIVFVAKKISKRQAESANEQTSRKEVWSNQ